MRSMKSDQKTCGTCLLREAGCCKITDNEVAENQQACIDHIDEEG